MQLLQIKLPTPTCTTMTPNPQFDVRAHILHKTIVTKQSPV